MLCISKTQVHSLENSVQCSEVSSGGIAVKSQAQKRTTGALTLLHASKSTDVTAFIVRVFCAGEQRDASALDVAIFSVTASFGLMENAGRRISGYADIGSIQRSTRYDLIALFCITIVRINFYQNSISDSVINRNSFHMGHLRLTNNLF